MRKTGKETIIKGWRSADALHDELADRLKNRDSLQQNRIHAVNGYQQVQKELFDLTNILDQVKMKRPLTNLDIFQIQQLQKQIASKKPESQHWYKLRELATSLELKNLNIITELRIRLQRLTSKSTNNLNSLFANLSIRKKTGKKMGSILKGINNLNLK